jgi:hypothetical protein
MAFLEFWLAMGRTGKEGFARAQWGKLSAADQAAKEPMAVPTTTASRPEQVWLHERTAEWRCWQRHLVATTGLGTPIDSQRRLALPQ